MTELQRPSGCRTRCPRPLEVESANVAGHIDNFADEEQARNLARLHRFGRKFVGIDTTRSHLGLLEAFGSFRCDGPRMQSLLKIAQPRICPRGGRMKLCPPVREAGRKNFSQLATQR